MCMYCGCNRVRQLGERGSLGREGRGEEHGYSEVPRFQGGSSHLCRLRTERFGPDGKL
jgi:hypothetical protein